MQAQSERAQTVRTQMSFALPDNVAPDGDGSGVLRAKTMDATTMGLPESYARRSCLVHDCSALSDPGGLRPDIVEHGFGYIDLGEMAALQAILGRVTEAGHVADADAVAIRRELRGNAFSLGDGSAMLVLYIAPEGFIMRTAGPNGRDMNPGGSRQGMNNHVAAAAVHIDQDVDGTPVRQILRRAAPFVFHHDSPLHRNARSPVFLLNIWVPLVQQTAPLALMDKRTMDRRRHQLRYGLPTDGFLERKADRRVNDIWMLLHDERQQWYFTSEFDSRRAYIFETLSTPHGAFVLPGEDRADVRYRQLEAILDAIERRDEAALTQAALPRADGTSEAVTRPLRASIEAMEAMIAQAHKEAPNLCRGEGAADWRQRARQCMGRVVRKSLEMRAVGIRIPDMRHLGRR